MSQAAGMFRRTSVNRDVRAGCFVCNGSEPLWYGGQAQGTAARHHDATRHQTWCDVIMSVVYGVDAPDGRQTDLEDAIAAKAAPETGRRPDEAATRPVLDAPAAATAGVSAPRGRPSRRSAIRPRGARGRKPETKSP